MPDHEALPDMCYLPFDKTPIVTSTGSQREVEDDQPRAQVKTWFQNGTLVLNNAESTKTFPKTFAVEEVLQESTFNIWNTYNWKKKRGSEERRQKKQEEVRKTYNDFNWVQIFHEGKC